MWTQQSPPEVIKNKSIDLIKLGVQVANTALENGHSEEEAIFACLSAIKRIEKSTTKPLEAFKPRVPSHVAALLNKAAVEPSDALPEPVVEDNSIASAEFDAKGHLVIQFKNGSKLISRTTASDEIYQSVAVNVNPVFDYIRFNPDITNVIPHEEALLFYDKEDHSLAYYNDDSAVKVNIGREELIRVYNNNAFNLTDGKVVYINGAIGGYPTVGLSKADTEAASQSTIGVVTSLIEPNSYGYICVSGLVHNLDTSAYANGAVLYLSPTTAGEFTDVPPLQPHYKIEICTVVSSSSTEGHILVNIDKKPWFPSIELLHTEPSTILPTVPTIFKPSVVAYNDGFNFDLPTGELTFNVSAPFGLTIQLNALPSAANKHIYFYVEVNQGVGWVISKYSARQLELINATETQLIISGNKYYPIGTKLRFYIWGDNQITLKSTDLPGTAAGTVVLPAFRLSLA